MREAYLDRLRTPTTSINDHYYLVNKSLYKDLKYAIKKYARGNVFDIGCGNKPYKIFFGQEIESYTGCDVVQSSEKCVDILCEATSIPSDSNNYDTVFSTQVLEHVADHTRMLEEASRLLKSNGILIISAPMYWEHHEEPYDFFRFTKYGFEYLLNKTGFEKIEIIPNGGKWALTGQVILNNLKSGFNKRKGILSKTFRLFYLILRIKWFVNVFFSMLDRIDYDTYTTLNFVVIAKKRS